MELDQIDELSGDDITIFSSKFRDHCQSLGEILYAYVRLMQATVPVDLSFSIKAEQTIRRPTMNVQRS